MVYLRFLKNSFLEANVTIIYVPITIFVYTLKFKLVWHYVFGNQSSSRLKCLIPEDSFLMNLFPTSTYSRYFRYFYMCRTMQSELRGHANFYHIVLWHQFIYLKFHQGVQKFTPAWFVNQCKFTDHLFHVYYECMGIIFDNDLIFLEVSFELPVLVDLILSMSTFNILILMTCTLFKHLLFMWWFF